MKDTEFTPGPWEKTTETRPYQKARGKMVISDSAGAMDAVCWIRCGRKQSNANAHLITAAPNLYAALSDLVCITDKYASGEMDGPALIMARQIAKYALAKARGETT